MNFSIDRYELNHSCIKEWIQQAQDIYLKMGFIVVKNLFEPCFAMRLCRDYNALYSKYFFEEECKSYTDVGEKRPFLGLDFQGVFKEPHWYANKSLLFLLKSILSEDLIIGGQGSFIALPGAKNQHIHSDSGNMYSVGGEEMVKKGKPYAVTVGFPLVQTNQLCGGTRFWPGSHLQLDYEDDEFVDVYCSPGDALVFDFRTFHAGLANRAPVARPMLYTVYARYWYRDQVNYNQHEPLNMTQEMLDEVPIEYKGLFDWYFNSDELKTN